MAEAPRIVRIVLKPLEVSIGSVHAGETTVQRADPESARPVLLNGPNLVPWETVHISWIPEVSHELLCGPL